jgi:2-polyprenyl-3-methyl-5-hydroxy-6-metoxy-1,4-benzoquinol methylase
MSVDQEIRKGERFRFGKNWARFLESLSEPRILSANEALKTLLGVEDLSGKRFADVGSGSGLSSLAARRLGASVVSFDYDPDSVECTRELRRRLGGENPAEWDVLEGSVLDAGFIQKLGQFDVVYSWGVLHHTGEMWRALDQVTRLVVPGGLLAIAIYNDQGLASRLWLKVKQTYCGSAPGRLAMCSIFIPYFMARGASMDLLAGRNPLARYRTTGVRGMSVVRDWFDWIGGLPFEVAGPGLIFDFYRKRGYELVALTTVGGAMGCNEYVFRGLRTA